MQNKNEKFRDDLENQSLHKKKNRPDSGSTNNHSNLEDKWNEIQEEYLAQHPDIDTEDLYFEAGGFNGIVEKIAEITGKSVDSVRDEIEKW